MMETDQEKDTHTHTYTHPKKSGRLRAALNWGGKQGQFFHGVANKTVRLLTPAEALRHRMVLLYVYLKCRPSSALFPAGSFLHQALKVFAGHPGHLAPLAPFFPWPCQPLSFPNAA